MTRPGIPEILQVRNWKKQGSTRQLKPRVVVYIYLHINFLWGNAYFLAKQGWIGKKTLYLFKGPPTIGFLGCGKKKI